MSKIIEVGADEFDNEVLQADKPVLVDFWAEWCGPCRSLTPIVEAVADQYSDDLKVVKVNVDNDQELAGQYNVRGIPALLLFKDGDVQERHVGALSKSELEDFIEKVA